MNLVLRSWFSFSSLADFIVVTLAFCFARQSHFSYPGDFVFRQSRFSSLADFVLVTLAFCFARQSSSSSRGDLLLLFARVYGTFSFEFPCMYLTSVESSNSDGGVKTFALVLDALSLSLRFELLASHWTNPVLYSPLY